MCIINFSAVHVICPGCIFYVYSDVTVGLKTILQVAAVIIP